MFKFTKLNNPNNDYDISDVNITIVSEDVSLTEVLHTFREFLLASGFIIKGNLVISDEEE